MFRATRVLTALGVLVLLLLTIARPDARTAHAILEDTDFDGALDIAEEATGSDPLDPNSVPETTGAAFVSGFDLCADGLDNDLDGLTDADDPGCTDSDGDIVADPGEVYYGSDPNDVTSTPESAILDAILDYSGLPVVFCADGVDNDGDGLTDADDPGCEPIVNDGDGFDDFTEKRWGSDPGDPDSVPEHEFPNPGSCSDGIDNDLDGLTDGADPACGSPDNDDRADAIVIDSVPFVDGPAVLKNATVEQDEPQPSCLFGDLGGTVWYRYTAVADGVLIADTSGSDFATSIAVWQDGAALEEVACGASLSFTGSSRAVFAATAGTTYLFQIDGFAYGSPLPQLVFNLATGVPPANDSFADATDIDALPFSDEVDVSAALTQFGEPRSRCTGEPESTVWYTFTPAGDLRLLADTTGSGLSTVISVYTDSKFGLAEIACTGPIATDSRLAFDVDAGETYYIQIGRYPYDYYFPPSQLTFDLVFNLAVAEPPANDDFANAKTLTTLPFASDPLDMLTSSVETGEPRPSCLPYDRVRASLWYSYTPASDAVLLAETLGAFYSYSTVIGVYQGATLSSLTEVSCGWPSYPGARVGFQARAGETYLIQVGSIISGGVFIGGEADTNGFFPPPPEEQDLTFSLADIDPPACPAEDFFVADRLGDTPDIAIDRVVHDITAVHGGTAGGVTCITVDFAGPVHPPGESDDAVLLVLDVDADANRRTGIGSSIDYYCPGNAFLGVETQVFMQEGSGILASVYQYGPDGPPFDGQQPYALALFDERSITINIATDLIGGDGTFDFALYARGLDYLTSDCAPGGGHIQSPDPAPPGDVNCDGRADSRDVTLILQDFARLTFGMPCEYVGDLNNNGDVGPLDAVLILQYEAGLLDELPVVPNNAVLAAVEATGELLGILRGTIELESKEARTWPDSCLGLADPGEACLEVLTPGYHIVLEVPEDGPARRFYAWRTNETGSEVRLEESYCDPCPPVP